MFQKSKPQLGSFVFFGSQNLSLNLFSTLGFKDNRENRREISLASQTFRDRCQVRTILEILSFCMAKGDEHEDVSIVDVN